MSKERNFSRTEACLGLTLLAGLLATLLGVYLLRFEEPTPVTPPELNWAASRPIDPPSEPIQQTAYRPQWLAPASESHESSSQSQ